MAGGGGGVEGGFCLFFNLSCKKTCTLLVIFYISLPCFLLFFVFFPPLVIHRSSLVLL